MNTFTLRNWIASVLLAMAVSACSPAGSLAATITTAPTIALPEMTSTATPIAAATRVGAAPPITAATFAAADTQSVPTPQATTTPNAAGVFPIVDGGSGFVLGGVKDGRWLDADTTAALVPNEMNYRVFTGSYLKTKATGILVARDFGPHDPCPFPTIILSPDQDSTSSIAVAGDWDVAPRVTQNLSIDHPDYLPPIETLLVEDGIAAPVVTLSAVYRVDLEGDGTDEVVVSAVHLPDTQDIKAGGYAVVALRKIVDGQVKTIPFIHAAYPQDSSAQPWYPTIRGLLDLNGDGRLEIIVDQQAPIGRFTEVYEVNGAEVMRVLRAGCSI